MHLVKCILYISVGNLGCDSFILKWQWNTVISPIACFNITTFLFNCHPVLIDDTVREGVTWYLAARMHMVLEIGRCFVYCFKWVGLGLIKFKGKVIYELDISVG